MRFVGAAADVVGDVGAVGEDGAGHEGMGFAVEEEMAFALGDEFDGDVGEIFAGGAVVGGAMFVAAADDVEVFDGGGVETEEEAAGFGDLAGEEFGLAPGAGS